MGFGKKKDKPAPVAEAKPQTTAVKGGATQEEQTRLAGRGTEAGVNQSLLASDDQGAPNTAPLAKKKTNSLLA